MTKQEIQNKREYIYASIRKQIKQMHSILKAFGEIPEIANNGDANILINEILMRIGSSERDILVFKWKTDDYIERYDEKQYLNYVQGKIHFYIDRYDFYAFNASLRHRDYEYKPCLLYTSPSPRDA